MRLAILPTAGANLMPNAMIGRLPHMNPPWECYRWHKIVVRKSSQLLQHPRRDMSRSNSKLGTARRQNRQLILKDHYDVERIMETLIEVGM